MIVCSSARRKKGQESEGDRMRAGGEGKERIIKIYGEIKVDRDEGRI